MAVKDIASKILEQIENGTRDIYQKYQKLMEANKIGYDTAVKELDKDYYRAVGSATAQSKINLDNSLEKLASKGLSSSGVSLHSEAVARSGLMSALATLDSEKMKEKSKLADSMRKGTLETESKMADEAEKYKTDLYKAYYSQLEKDRKYEAENNSAVMMSVPVTKLLSDIIDANTVYNSSDKSKTVYKSKIKNALIDILDNKSIDRKYRIELENYARATGYLW